MFAPEVEARFKKIEDNLTAAAEILRRFEDEGEGRRGRVEAIRESTARWLAEFNHKMNVIAATHTRVEASLKRLSGTVDRFLKPRTNEPQN